MFQKQFFENIYFEKEISRWQKKLANYPAFKELIKFDCNSIQDEAWEERDLDINKIEFTGRRKKRLCLVLDCLIPHNFSNDNIDLINLQHYVIKEKKLSEKEAIVIFADIIRVVESLHKVKKPVWLL